MPVLLNYYTVLNVPDWKKSNNLIKSIGMMEHSVNFHLNLQRFKCRRLFSEESVFEESVSFVINENILESRLDLIFFSAVWFNMKYDHHINILRSSQETLRNLAAPEV